MTATQMMNRRQRLVYFPSLHADENKFFTIFKFVFEVITKITINWWALSLTWVGEKTRQKLLVVVIKQIPNGLSFVRILAMPVICFYLVVAIRNGVHMDASYWFVIMFVVISLDALDGPAARDLDAVSEFGARLDPASDKFCFVCIVLAYCIASLSEYGIEYCVVAFGLALWCLHVEFKLIRLSVGPMRKLFDVLKFYNPDFTDPGAFLPGKIKFNLQMLACVVGWLGLIWFPANPIAILAMAIVLFAARWYGGKSLNMHRDEYVCLLAVAIMLQNQPRWGKGETNVVQIRKPA